LRVLCGKKWIIKRYLDKLRAIASNSVVRGSILTSKLQSNAVGPCSTNLLAPLTSELLSPLTSSSSYQYQQDERALPGTPPSVKCTVSHYCPTTFFSLIHSLRLQRFNEICQMPNNIAMFYEEPVSLPKLWKAKSTSL
jgi:hypothetical protein